VLVECGRQLEQSGAAHWEYVLLTLTILHESLTAPASLGELRRASARRRTTEDGMKQTSNDQ